MSLLTSCASLVDTKQKKTKKSNKRVFLEQKYTFIKGGIMRMGWGWGWGGSEKSEELQVQWKQAGVCGVAVLSWCISPNSPVNIYSTGVQAVNTLHYHCCSPTRPREKVAPYFHSAWPSKLILPWTVITAAWLLFYQHQSLKLVSGNQGWLQLLLRKCGAQRWWAASDLKTWSHVYFWQVRLSVG